MGTQNEDGRRHVDKTPNSYAYFLNGHNPESDSLARLALGDFRDQSGLLEETLERAQIRIFSRDTDILKERLGFASLIGQPILKLARLVEIPSVGANGAVTEDHFRLNPVIDEKNHLAPKGQPARLYIPVETWGIKGNSNIPLWIVEGAKKCLKLLQHGRPSRDLRVIKRVTQSQPRLTTGIHQSKISMLENGLIQPREDEREKLARALGVHVGELFPTEGESHGSEMAA
jgi:hypothetical protein